MKQFIIILAMFVLNPLFSTPKVMIEVSFGELIDKITILEIKNERIKDPLKLQNIHNELSSLHATLEESGIYSDPLKKLYSQLYAINSELWGIESALREKEQQHSFDE